MQDKAQTQRIRNSAVRTKLQGKASVQRLQNKASRSFSAKLQDTASDEVPGPSSRTMLQDKGFRRKLQLKSFRTELQDNGSRRQLQNKASAQMLLDRVLTTEASGHRFRTKLQNTAAGQSFRTPLPDDMPFSTKASEHPIDRNS